MAPIRSSSNKSSVLRQGTLSFASTKRTGSTSTTGKQKKAVQSTPTTTERSLSLSGPERSGASTPVEANAGSLQPSKAYREEAPRSLRPAKRRHVSPSPEVALPPPRDEAVVVREERPRLNPKDRRWAKIRKATKAKMGNAAPVHAENENEISKILRIFDLSDEYGPCIGVSRLERWERAHAFGMNPPEEVNRSLFLDRNYLINDNICRPQVREILNTLEGSEKPEYSQCVFHDLV
ncbi:hypothetical protein M378DRAFT_176093 [Amanita muscaria Koide BX008]|uniref:DNA polymerase delta subunit 4 n=1 Tax=Amanita muscaria (strain Koide BX008) TaxID=946122 RepID=A0A0C2X4D1_AMAMK|nr:hypothetical protein M378DRAFT_176093 [Amanita muscaria Koide BX008]